jgi:hypothetical protein
MPVLSSTQSGLKCLAMVIGTASMVLGVRFRLVINRFNKEMRVRFLPFFERLNWR